MLSLLTSQYKMAACGSGAASGAANLFDYFPSDKRADSDTVTASDKEPSLEPFLEPLKKKPRRQFQRSWLNRWSWVCYNEEEIMYCSLCREVSLRQIK